MVVEPERGSDTSSEDALARAGRSERLLGLFLEKAPDIVTVPQPDLSQRSVAGAAEQRTARSVSALSYVHGFPAVCLVQRVFARDASEVEQPRAGQDAIRLSPLGGAELGLGRVAL